MAGLDAWQMRGGQAPRAPPGGNEFEYMPLLASEPGQGSADSARNHHTGDGMAQGGAAFADRGEAFTSSGGASRGGLAYDPHRSGLDAQRSAYGLGSQSSGFGGSGNGGHGSNNGGGSSASLETNASGPDIVQFSSMFFYVNEGSGKVAVTAMRIGSLTTPCSIEFRTEDNSAKAGMKYKETKGKIDFLPGEEMKSIEIKILEDDSFDTNLDFRVVMSSPLGCQLGDHLKACRIVIIDDDVFPTNKYREQILKEDVDAFGVRLLLHFIKFSIQRIPLVGWRTGWNLVVDQFANVNYLLGIFLNVYLVDVVFAVHRPGSEDELWIKGQRLWTVVLVAMGIIVPKALLTYIDWQKEGQLAVGGKVKLHLKVNLFRKYLYYSAASHTKVSAQELTKAMEGDINELVQHGFMAIFQIAQQTVKVGVILAFLVHKRPSSAAPLLVYPIAMAVVLNMRYEQTLHLKDKLRDAEKSTMICLRESCDDINLIKEYNMRTAVVTRYEDSIKAQGPPGDNYAHFDFRTMMVMPWITNFAIMLFMIVGGHFVLLGELSLGAYLATIGIYKDAGELFGGFYTHLKEFYGVIGPLLRVVRLLNLETDVHGSMAQAKERSDGMLQELKAEEKMRKQFSLSPRATSRFDMLHLKLVHASLANDRGGPASSSMQDISVEVPQGKMIAILGPHGSGKFSLLRLLTGLVKPKNGEVHAPTHLRCLCVGQPEIFKNGGLLENLTFGTKGNFDKNRLIKLCGAVGLGEHTMKILEQEMKEDVGGETQAKQYSKIASVPWYEQLSGSELLKMHITRALNLNPEVLLLRRPVDELEADHAARILDVLRQYVDHRGLFLTPHQRAAARPHTVFFTSGEDRERSDSAKDVADVIWHLSDKGFIVEQGGGNPAAISASRNESRGHEGGNRIVNSWSREVRSLQVNLDKEKHLHTATLEELESHRGELENSRLEAENLKGALGDVTSQAKRALRDAKSYESELAAWEGEQSKSSWLPCVERGTPPAPRQLSQSLSQMITSGEGRPKDQRARSQSPPAYSHGRGLR